MPRLSHSLTLLLGVAALCAAARPAAAQTVYYEAAPAVAYYAPASPTVTTYRYGLGILPRNRVTVATYPAPVVQSAYYAPAPVVTPTYYAPAPVVTSYYYAPAPVVVRRPAVRYYAAPVVVYP